MSGETPDSMRDQIDALTKDLNKAKRQVDELLKENRGLKARDAFSEINPDLAELFVAVNPEAEITVDAAKEFAAKYNFGAAAPAEEEEEETPSPTDNSKLNLINRAGSGAGQGGTAGPGEQVLSVPEYVTLLKKDKAAAEEALAKGLVRVRDDNPMARDRINFGDENPFGRFNREAIQSKQS